ncbi:hypothetical protein KR018_009978 [Drosophila ironensis]|nr:hypothetical protein KR018_009978 [Drosophila ironensis]
MANRILWSLLIALAALQSSNGAPVLAKMQLDLYVTNEILQLLSGTLDEIANFLQSVIDEAERVLPSNAESLLLLELKRFVSMVNSLDHSSEELENIEEMFDLIGLTNIFEPLASMENLSKADQIVLQILTNHGVDVLEDRLVAKMHKTLDRIEQKIDKYIMSWSDNKASRKSDFIRWYNNFKNEDDIIAKVEMLFNDDFL